MEYILIALQKEIKNIIGDKNNITNIYRIQAYNSTCRHFCIELINFMLKGKSVLEYTNLFSRNDCEKNDKIILKYLQKLKRWKNMSCVIWGKYRKFEKPKTSYLLKKTLNLSISCSKCKE